MSQIAIVVLSSDNAKNIRKPEQLVSWGDPAVLSTVIANVFSTDGDIFFVVPGDNRNETKQKLSLSETAVTVYINEIGEQGLGYSVALAI